MDPCLGWSLHPPILLVSASPTPASAVPSHSPVLFVHFVLFFSVMEIAQPFLFCILFLRWSLANFAWAGLQLTILQPLPPD
jgi:hypothetical protein